MGVARLLWQVVKCAPAVADGGGGRKQRGGDRCPGDSAGARCWGGSGAPAVKGPAGGAWWATGNVGRGWRTPCGAGGGAGGGGRSGCGDHRGRGGSCGKEGDGGEA